MKILKNVLHNKIRELFKKQFSYKYFLLHGQTQYSIYPYSGSIYSLDILYPLKVY